MLRKKSERIIRAVSEIDHRQQSLTVGLDLSGVTGGKYAETS